MQGTSMSGRARRLVVGITDAEGADYAVRLLELLRPQTVEVHLVMSDAARALLETGSGVSPDTIAALADVVHQPGNMAARISSGSFLVDGMIVAPCSVPAAGAIAQGLGTNLIHRAADVMMKERRPLALLVMQGELSEGGRENLDRLAAVPGVRVIYPASSEGGTLDPAADGALDRTVDLLLQSVGFDRED